MKLEMFLFTTLFCVSSLAAGPCDSVSNSTAAYDSSTHQFKGCKLTAVDSKSIYADLGLKAGDIVQPTSVNSAKSMELYNVDANPGMRDLNSVIEKASPEEKKDLGKLMGQISVAPIKHSVPQNGTAVFKVIKVEKGSVYDREGLKAGDLVSQ